MAEIKPSRASARLDALGTALEQKLSNETGVLDLLVAAHARGQNVEGLWDKLHDAAARDDRLAELAFAYERFSGERRIKTMPAAAQAKLLHRAGVFFADVFGDPGGAEGYLERALALVPAETATFEKLESLLVARSDGLRLSELYEKAAAHRSGKDEQLALLRRAVELVDGFSGAQDRALKLYQDIVRLDPADIVSQGRLAERYASAGRHQDLARLLEQTLLAENAPEGGDAIVTRERLLALYAHKLGEIERALPHVEEILRFNPVHKAARDVAERLLSHKAMAARVASALDAVHERLGQPVEAARMLAIQIEQLRGPKRVEAQKRLALLHTKYAGELGDRAKAYALHEAIVVLDPGDDSVRERFLHLAEELDKRLDATRVLSRASNGSKDPAVRSRLGVEVGELFLALGDPKKARIALSSVVEAGGEDDAAIRAARAMDAITTEMNDRPGLAAVLARLADIEPDEDARLTATARLAEISEELRDPAAAVAAYRRLVGSAREPEALVALERLLEATGAHAELAVVLRRRAAAEPDRDASRALWLRACEIRSKLADRSAALEAWRGFVTTFGPAREAYAKMFPLLEQERAWEELAEALEADAKLAPDGERAPIFARLGQLRGARLNDAKGSLEAHAHALAADPSERTSRQAVERMLAAGDLRLEAADVIEPLARAEKSAALLARVLEARAAMSDNPRTRLGAIAEATQVMATELRDPKRGLDFAGKGLALALDEAPGDVASWLLRIDQIAALAGDPARTAAVLKLALGDRAVDSDATLRLARRAGEALVASGDVASALAVFRAALAYDPSSAELLGRVDTLLREQGSPEERLALYRAALEQPCDAPRRRELLHAIGAIERRDLGDTKAAAATYRRTLDEDPTDAAAFEALTEIHETEEAWPALYDELERALARGQADERTATLLRMAAVARRAGKPEQAAAHYAEVLAGNDALPDEVLAAIDVLAAERDDPALAFAALGRRLAAATEPLDEALWLEKIGDLELGRLARPEEALARFRRAAECALAGLDAALAERLFERVLELAPGDRAAAEKLLGLYGDADGFDKLARVYPVLLRAASDRAEAVDLLVAFEPVALKAAALAAFVAEADALLAKELSADARRAVRAARARILAADPETAPRASAAYRQMIEEGDGDAMAAFEAFLSARGALAIDDRRWLHALRVERAAELDLTRLLIAWAQFEEAVAKDPARACELYAKVLVADPDHDDALAARARLLLDLGDLEGAALAIATRRDKSEGPARVALELELGTLLLDRLDRPNEALDAVGEVLEGAPSDAAALALVERALARPISQLRAARMLERAAEAVDDPELSASILDVLLSTPIETPELATARRAWFERLLDRPDQPPERTLDLALRAVRELPLDGALWTRAERLGRAVNKPELVADAYRRELARLAQTGAESRGDADALEDIGRRAIEYLEEWFDDPESVVVLLRRVVELVPTSAWAFERLKLVYNLGERWDELFELYDGVIKSARDADVRADLLEDAAFAAKDLAGDAPRATSYFEALLPMRREARVLSALERLYERQGRHRELIVLLTPDLADLQGEAAHRLRARLAELWLDGVDDPASALELAEPLLGSDAFGKEALDLVERILRAASEPSRREAVRATSRRAAAVLCERYEASGRPADLARVLAIEIEASDVPAERADRLRRIVRIRERDLGDEGGAFDALADLVLLEPEGAIARAEFVALGDKLGRHARLGDVLATAADRTFGPLRAELLAQAAAIFDLKVGDVGRAIALARSVLGAAHADPAASLKAARELDRLLAQAGRIADRPDVLERLAELEPEQDARRAALRELAQLSLREGGDPERAVRALRQALALLPSDEASRDDLVAALERAGRIDELIELLEDRADEREGVSARADRVRIARLHEAREGGIDHAIEAWNEIRDKHGADVETADALSALLERASRWDDLVALLEREASDARSPERAADLFRRLGDLHREHTGRWREAVAAYELCLEARSTDAGARRGLEALAFRFDLAEPEQRSVIASAVTALVRLAVSDHDDPAVVALLEPRLAVAESDAERVAILNETAGLLEVRGDLSAAFDATWRALGLVATEELARESARLALAADRLSTVAEGLEAFDAKNPPPAAVQVLASASARWHEERGELALAERALERALVRAPRDLEILEALATLERRAPGRALVVTLLRLAETKRGDLDDLREAVDIALDPVADRALAKTIAEKLLDAAEERWLAGDVGASKRFASPSEAAAWALEVLARLIHNDAPARLVDLFLRGARLPFDAGERRRLHLRAAEFADKDQTIAIYEHLFAEDPADPLAVERLEALYKAEGRRAELLVMRERQIAVTASPERKIELRFELACLLAEAGEPAQALAALRENLGMAPGHAATATKFSELLESGGHHAELVAHAEDQAARAEMANDLPAAAALWSKAASVSEARLADPSRAVNNHRRAAALGSVASVDALARLYAGRGEHAAAAEMLEKLCESAAREAMPALTLRLAEALVSAGRTDAARERLAHVVADHDAPELRERLAVLHREAGDYPALAALLADDASRAPDRATRAARLAQAAELYARECNDPASAIPLLEQARELAPDELAPKLALSTALAAAGRLDEASRSLTQIIQGYGGRRPKERALVHHYLARVALAAGDRAQALGELDVALRIDPAHPEILHALARLAFEEGQLDRANRTYRALLLVVRRPREEATNATVSRAEVLLELSEIAELQEDAPRATEYLASAFEAARDAPGERARLFAALRARGRFETLATALESRVAEGGEPSDIAVALGELAELYSGPLARPEQALSALLRAVALTPDVVAVRESALALARRIGQLERYVTTLGELVDSAASKDRATERRLWLGRMLEVDVGDDRRAAAAYERAEADVTAGDRRLAEIWRALEGIHARLGNPAAQAAILEKRIAASNDLPPDERADPLYRLAGLWLADESTQADAFDLLGRALALAPDAARAGNALRAALDRRPDSERLLRFFERFAREHGDRRALCDALSALSDRAARGVVTLVAGEEPLREAVDVALSIEDRPLAESILRRVLEPDGPDAPRAWAMIALAHLAEDEGKIGDAALLRERAAPHFDAEEERQLLLGVAAAAAGPLGDLDRAARIYEALRAREPADRELWQPLADVYRKRGDEERLVSLLEETTPLVDEPKERAAMGLERAKIVMRRDEQAAAALLYDVLENDSAQVEAAMLLSTMLEKAGHKDELATLLARQLEAAKDREDVPSIVSLSLRLGALREQQGSEEEALHVYHAALDWDKTAREILRAILRLAFARNDSMDLGDALEQMIAVEVGDEAVNLALQLAELRTAHKDPIGAERALELGFVQAPSSARLREELAQRYGAREAWSKLADLHVKDAEARTVPNEKVEAFCRAADVLRSRANNAGAAAEVLRRALEVDRKERDVLMALLDAYAEVGEHDRAIEAVTGAIEVDAEDAWLYRARAQLHEAKGEDQLALVDLESAYEKSRGGYANELVVQLDRAVARSSDGSPEARTAERTLRLRAAEVLFAAGEIDRARANLADLVRKDAKDKVALRRLAELETRAERWDAVSATWRRLLALEEGDALVEAAIFLADACERDGRLADARGGLERALRVAPNKPEVRARLRAVYDATGASRELAQMILEDAAAAPDVAGRFTQLLHAGRLLLDSDIESDLVQATQVLEQARGLRPEDADATLLLSDAYAFLGRRPEARALLDGAIALHKGRRAKQLAPVYRRLSRLDREENNLARSFAALLRAFENDSHSGSLAMELGGFALERGDLEIAQRAFRTVTLMKLTPPGSSDGTTQPARAVAYFQLGRIAVAQGDKRKARLLLEKAVAEDANNEDARVMLEELRGGP